jgi:GTP-binding protein
MDFQKTTFVKTVVRVEDRPRFSLPEIILIGRSNVGKSSLINALTGQKKLAKTSATPGKTRHLNYYMVDHQLYLVDAPGFGYTQYGKQEMQRFAELMQPYFSEAKPKLGLYLMDSRREVLETDVVFIQELNRFMNVLIVFTKIDVLNQKEQAALLKQLKTLGLPTQDYAFVSRDNPRLIQKLKEQIQGYISNPKAKSE